jgi:hypothetical protein
MKEQLFKVTLVRARDEYTTVLVRAVDDQMAAAGAMDRRYDDDLNWEPAGDSYKDVTVDTVERVGVAEKIR